MPARANGGCPKLRVHDLRHTGATLAAQHGATLAELMRRIGHSTPQAAMIYQHATDARDEELARRMSKAARKAKKKAAKKAKEEDATERSGLHGPRFRNSATCSMTDTPADWLDAEAWRFGDDVAALLARTLPGAPGVNVDVVGQKLRITPDGQHVDDHGKEHGGVPLRVRDDVELAWSRINFACQPDSSHKYLAVGGSKSWVVSTKERSPLLRLEYNREEWSEPHSHIQVHAERGAFSHLLTRTGHRRAHDLSALHLPTGGSRFRPGLEDVIQFLIVDCRVRSVDGWRQAVEEHRARWREIQAAAAARAMPGVAARELRDLGYDVNPPAGGDPEPGRRARCTW